MSQAEHIEMLREDSKIAEELLHYVKYEVAENPYKNLLLRLCSRYVKAKENELEYALKTANKGKHWGEEDVSLLKKILMREGLATSYDKERKNLDILVQELKRSRQRVKIKAYELGMKEYVNNIEYRYRRFLP